MDDHEPDTGVNHRIAARVRELRAAHGLSLDALAAKSGVSRSALSLIERAQSSPTAVVLDRIAAALGVSLSALFEPAGPPAARSPLARRADQVVWRDPGSGYTRRAVTPPHAAGPARIVEVEFPAGARIAYEVGPREPAVHQQVWMLDGTIDFSLGETTWRLKAGDCVAVRLDAPTVFRNPTRRPARYAVVVATEPGGARR